MVWAPADDELEGYRLAGSIASEAAYSDPPNGLCLLIGNVITIGIDA